MKKLGEYLQSGDFKLEKHLPIIECPDEVKAGERLTVTVSVGKELPHPNTTEHHIRWIQLFFQPEGDKYSYQAGNYEFGAHGEAAQGANQGPVYSESIVTTVLRLKKPGTLYALSLCNIHGLWEAASTIKVS